MKVYVVSQSVSDDDGNIYSTTEGVYHDLKEAIMKVKTLHDDVLTYFSNPEDNYEDGDRWFEIYESDDMQICRTVSIHEEEVK